MAHCKIPRFDAACHPPDIDLRGTHQEPARAPKVAQGQENSTVHDATMKPLFILILSAGIAAPALAAEVKAQPKADPAKGQALSTQVCGACHTADGSRGVPANPILAGQHPEYLVKQLDEYKTGKRNNAVMKGFASTLSEDDMRNVAA